MSVDFVVKQQDLRPYLSVVLTTQGFPVDLTSAESVSFQMRALGEPDPVVSGPAEVTNAVGGQVLYAWQPGDTDAAGDYHASFRVMWPTGPQTFPTEGTLLVRIEPDLVTDDLDPTGPDYAFCTIADVKRYAGEDVSQDKVDQAQAQIEVLVGRTIEEVSDLIAADSISTSDLKWLKLACAYQAAWISYNSDWASRLSMSAVSQNPATQLTEDGQSIAPLARRSALRLSWMGSRIVRVTRSTESPYYDDSRLWRRW